MQNSGDLNDLLNKIKESEEENIAQKLAEILNLNYFNLKVKHPNPEALKIIDKNTAQKLLILPIEKKGKNLIIGTINPADDRVVKFLEGLKKEGYNLTIGVISRSSFEKGIKDYEFVKKSKTKYTQILELDIEKVQEIISELKEKEDLNKIIQSLEENNILSILDYLIAGAIKFDSSDIHLEPTEKEIEIKLRIDGILYNVANLKKSIYPVIKNRIKLFSGLFLNITQKPQDGRFSISLGNKKIDIRVSTIPSTYDETIVMRLLNPEKILLSLNELGLEDYELKKIDYHIHQPNGLILNTGPTGSGKTTTLYAILKKIKRKEIKIITIEDPIEYQIEGITQTQVNLSENYTFATGLRSILRQDPNVILVGEIRDKDTAGIAINAALTGHLVLSTLHTNDSLGAIPRLIDLGVDKSLIPSALRLVIAQRLLRRVCEKCFEEYFPDQNIIQLIKKNLNNIPQDIYQKIDFENISLVKTKGCEQCFYTGYRGRIAIFELLEISEKIQEIIYKNPNEEEILKSVQKTGFVSLRQAGILKALKKITTIEEVERVTGKLI
ncbi:MAG: GspE/PulE family protein [Patescibacteria group bacterium]|nr:GspE/PulE family protein [Patescibacteria group bacterium]